MVDEEVAIRAIVKTAIESYSEGFETRHLNEIDDPEGTINMKIHNVFISALGPEIQFYTALVRSLDSSLGNMLEKMAINIAQLFFKVSQSVEGPLYKEQTKIIATILEKYKNRTKSPCVNDYLPLRFVKNRLDCNNIRHESDYYLVNENTKENFLIELKIGGDLDNKKARSEKEAILEQYAILSNTLSPNEKIKIYFATAYNRFGEDRPWKQERVRQFFADEELLIGKDFWNFICMSKDGYHIVIDEYTKHSKIILDALNKIKNEYIG